MKDTEYIKIDSAVSDEKAFLKAAAVLKKGGVVALPTETVYGLVVDMFSEKAVKKIYEIKGRDFSKPLTVFVADIENVNLYVEKLPDFAHKLMKVFCPGPLTIVLKKKSGLNVPFKTETLGFRIPDHPVPLALLKKCKALFSTSANVSGGKDALSAEEVKEYFDGKIELILDAGHTILQVPSTVVDCTGHSPKIIREGKIKKADIERITGSASGGIKMKSDISIALASDHAGFRYKEAIKKHLVKKNIKVLDFGADSDQSCDYPDFVRPAAEAVAKGEADYGIVLGGSGNGEAIVANKIKGIRCSLCWSYDTAKWARSHNDANVLAIGERTVSLEAALQIVDTWLSTAFEGGRHQRRIDLISQIENKLCSGYNEIIK